MFEAWASCFHPAFQDRRGAAGRAIVNSAVVAAVKLHSVADGRLVLKAALYVDVSGVAQVTAEELALAAYATSPYSVVASGNPPVSVTVRGGQRFR